MPPLALCSSSECNYRTELQDNKGRISIEIPLQCPKCGEPIISLCPRCQFLLLGNLDVKNPRCELCRQELKKTMPVRGEAECLFLEEKQRAFSLKHESDRSVGRLSKREIQVVQCLASGKSNKEIAVAFSLTVRTVETYRARVMLKLDVHSASDLTRFAVRHGLIEI